jgi:uncharacterized protein
LVEVICDTSFLMLLATKRIKNYFNLETEIGTVKFVVPEVVMKELHKLKNDPNKKLKVLTTLDFIKDFQIISMVGEYADNAIINYVRKHGGIVGTLDKELKLKIKKIGGSIISFSNDRIILES